MSRVRAPCSLHPLSALAVEPWSLASRMQPDAIRATGPIALTGCAGNAAMVAAVPGPAVGARRLSQEEVGDVRKVVGRLGRPLHGRQVRYIRYIRYVSRD